MDDGERDVLGKLMGRKSKDTKEPVVVEEVAGAQLS